MEEDDFTFSVPVGPQGRRDLCKGSVLFLSAALSIYFLEYSGFICALTLLLKLLGVGTCPMAVSFVFYIFSFVSFGGFFCFCFCFCFLSVAWSVTFFWCDGLFKLELTGFLGGIPLAPWQYLLCVFVYFLVFFVFFCFDFRSVLITFH